MRYLLDSDWLVDLLNGRIEPPLPDAAVSAGAAISILTYAEVYEGIYHGRRPRRDLRSLVRVLGVVKVLPISRPVARLAGVEAGRLRALGSPIALPDLLIAATALHHDLVLLTRNTRHYARVSGLSFLDSPLAT